MSDGLPVVPLTDNLVETFICFLPRLLHLVQGFIEVPLQPVNLLQHETAGTAAPICSALWGRKGT